MRKPKKLLAAIMSLIMIMSLIPVTALADEADDDLLGQQLEEKENQKQDPADGEPEEEETVTSELDALQARIDDLPGADELDMMDEDELQAVSDQVRDLLDELSDLDEDDYDALDLSRLYRLMAWFGNEPKTLDLAGSGTEADPYVVSSAGDLAEAVSKSGYIKLGADIYLESTVTITTGTNITLDLNGKAITVSQTNGRSLYAIDNYGTFTLTDNSDSGNGSITARGVENFGTMYMVGGTIDSCDSNGGGSAVWNEGTFEMTGGTLKFSGIKSGDSAGSPFTNDTAGATATITGGTFESPYTCIFVNAGTANVENITLSTETDYWMAAKVTGGTAYFKNVTINAENGGCIEVSTGTATLENCTFTQTNKGDPAYNSSAVAASNGGTVTVKGGTYKSSAFGAYVFNSGGTINIEGGTFEATTVLKADNPTTSSESVINISDGDFTGNLAIGDQSTLTISGGEFSTDIDDKYLSDTVKKETVNDKTVVTKLTAGDDGVVAKIGTDYYKSLSAAINDAEDGETVQLVNNVTESVTIPEGKSIILDLNGQTLTGASDSNGRMSNVVTNKGILTIKDSSESSTGTIMGGTDTNQSGNVGRGGIALVNNGTCTVESGTIKRGDDGTFGNYVVRNNGTMYITGGEITNNSNTSSMVINGYSDTDTEGIMVISGGVLTQNSMTALKNDTGTVTITENAAINSANNQALQNWGTVNMDGGTLNGKVNVYTWSYVEDGQTISTKAVLNVTGGTINAPTIYAWNYQYNDLSAVNAPVINISGNAVINAGGIAPVYEDQILNDVNGKDKAAVNVSGGTFNQVVPSYCCADGYTPVTTPGSDGKYTVEIDTGESGVFVARIGTQGYKTLQEAVDNAKDGDTVTLLKTTTDNTTIPITDGKKIELNLNGYNVGFAANSFFTVKNGCFDITGTGTIYEQVPYYSPIMVYGSAESTATNYSVVTVGPNVTLKGYSGLEIDNNTADKDKAYGVVVTVNGTLQGMADADGYGGIGLYVQGNITAQDGNVPKITIGNTAKLEAEAGGKEGADGTSVGMYLAGYADTTILNGATITAENGIEIRAGRLTVKGGTITGTGTPTTVTPNGNGTTTEGAGIAISQHTTKLPIDVAISGGVISGYTAFYETTPQTNPNPEVISISIQDGNFKAINNGTNAVHSDNKKEFISGGAYSHSAKEYVAKNLNAELQRKTGDTPFSYTTVEEALKNTDADVTITILNNGSEESEKDTVALDYGYDGIQKTIVVQKGATLTLPTLTREGYAFGDWYNGDENITSYTGVGKKTVTLTAKWTANNVTVSFYANGGEVESASINVAFGGTYGKLPTPTRTGYTFGGWYTAADGGDKVEADTTVSAASAHTLYAHWTINQYTIIFKNDDGSTISAITQDYNTGVTAPADPTKTGYTFTGWDKEIPTAMPAEDMTITAQWKINTYTVTFDSDGGSEVETQTVQYGGTAAKPENPTRSGYTFEGWFLGGEKFNFDTAITGDITLIAQWDRNSSGGGSSSSSTTYAVSVDSGKHGAVTVSPKNASKGTTVTITVKPDAGYELDDLTVTDKNGDSVKLTKKNDTKYTFIMPASKVTVDASFVKVEEEASEHAFIDVPNGYWAEDEIAWAYENGYMNGNTSVTFNPNGTVTRQQLWMILARLSGQRPADFAEARAWAMDNAISDGTNPGGAVTRQQMVAILYRYAQLMGYGTSGSAALTAFPDNGSVAAYAKDAMSWSVANGIVGGTTQGTLNPAGTATRAQFAVILYRFCDKVTK